MSMNKDMDNDDLLVGRAQNAGKFSPCSAFPAPTLIPTSLVSRAATGRAPISKRVLSTERSATASTALSSVCIVTPERPRGRTPSTNALPLRHPTDPSDGAISDGAAPTDVQHLQHQRRRLCAAGGRDGGHLALRRARRLLRRAGEQHRGEEVPARHAGDGRERGRDSPPSTPAGIRAAPSTSISRYAPIRSTRRARSSRRNSSSTTH